MPRTLRSATTRPAGEEPVRRWTPPQRLVDIVNPAVRALAESRAHALLDRSTLVLHVIGRKSGRCYDIPVSYVDVGGEMFVVSEHSWRRNLRGGVDLDVTLGGQRRPMHATLAEDPESVARCFSAIIDRLGWPVARRRLGLRTPGDQAPSADELMALVEADDLAVITLTCEDTWRDGVTSRWSDTASSRRIRARR